MHYQTSGSTMTGSWAFVNLSAPPPPLCCRCGQPAAGQTNPDGRTWCATHLQEIERAIAAQKIQASLQELFAATKPEQRKKLYRALAAVWHPDVGGDAALMVALNNVNDHLA